MASSSRPWQAAAESRSGGKMVRARRTAGSRTPYDRPPELPPNSIPQNPNWLSRLIYSPTRMIATGAGRLLSSVFAYDSSSSSSSSGSDSEDGIDDENDDNFITSQAIVAVQKNEMQSVVKKSETKHLIEQLIMQVTFSREECDRLTSIIKSRVVDGPSIADIEDRRLSELPNRTISSDLDTPDPTATAMEAKKWLEEKKSGSNRKSELELGTCTLNSAMLPHVTECEVGSPVDMAKSYMRTRLLWASPSANQSEYRSPSPTGIQLFKEEAPYSTGCSSLTSCKKKRDSPASGSWNILEEIRKVRSKATEELLRTPPSSKVDWSSFGLGNKSMANSLVGDNVEASMGNKVRSSTEPIGVSEKLVNGVSTSYGFPVSEATQDRLQNEVVPRNPATIVAEQNQDLQDIQTETTGLWDGTKGRLSSGQRVKSLEDINTLSQRDADAANIDGCKDTNGTIQPFNSSMGVTTQGLKVALALNAVTGSGLNKNCSTSKEMVATGGSFALNGFPSSGSSLPPVQDREQNSRPSGENQNPISSGHDEVPPSAPMTEACQFLSEASVDVPDAHEYDSIATGSQNSSSMHNEGLSQDLTMPSSKPRSVGTEKQGKKPSSVATEKLGKKPSRYNRRGRGR